LGHGSFQTFLNVLQATASLCPMLQRQFSAALGPMTARLLPERFADYRVIHRGADVIVCVCGCGTSLALLEHPERFLTTSVNDVGRLFTTDYLVVIYDQVIQRSEVSGGTACAKRSVA
jgi:hypothetical protein